MKKVIIKTNCSISTNSTYGMLVLVSRIKDHLFSILLITKSNGMFVNIEITSSESKTKLSISMPFNNLKAPKLL